MDIRKKGDYSYVVYSLVVVAVWGLVPGLAKKSSLSGGLTTMYVNWFAVIGVLAIMLANGAIRKINRKPAYGKLISLGLIWPLAYSIAYFSSVDLGSSSMTTITNYFWPIFYFGLAFLIFRKRISRSSWLVVILAALAVATPIALEEKLRFDLWPVVLGLVAALAQAVYSLLTEKIEENAWLVTFVVEVVTAVGATIYVLLFEQIVIPDLEALGYLAFIGVLANGVGFWAFLEASRRSACKGEKSKTMFLILICLTPLIQVLVLPLLGVEKIVPTRLAGVVMIALALVGNSFLSIRQKAPDVA